MQNMETKTKPDLEQFFDIDEAKEEKAIDSFQIESTQSYQNCHSCDAIGQNVVPLALTL